MEEYPEENIYENPETILEKIDRIKGDNYKESWDELEKSLESYEKALNVKPKKGRKWSLCKEISNRLSKK